jgi:hypothetical protein
MTRRLAPLLVAAGAFVAFLPALGNDFVNWDDDRNFLENPDYRGLGWRQLGWMFTTTHMGHYTPLTWLTLGLDYLLWGMDARGYHLTSLILHGAAAIVFYFLSLRLLRAARPPGTAADRPGAPDVRIGAAVAALLFAVHPLRVESVIWVTERRDVLSGLLFLVAIVAYLKAVDGGELRWRWYCAALVLFGGALSAKASTMPLPFVLLVLDVYPLRRLGGARGWWVARVWLEKLPFAILAAAAVVMAFLALATLGNTPSLGAMPLVLRAMIAVYGLAFYVVKTVLPLELSPLYRLPITVTWIHFAIVLGGTAAAIAFRRRWPALTAAAAAYGLLLLPVLRLVQGGPQMVADRYAYLSCLGWALLVGAAVSWRWSGTRVVRVVAVAWILVLGALSWQQTEVWRSSETLWRHALTVHPESRPAHFNLARAHAAEGHLAAAIAQYEETLRRSSSGASMHAAIGELYERAGIRRAAIERYTAALRESPGLPDACRGIRRLAAQTRGPLEALATCPSG